MLQDSLLGVECRAERLIVVVNQQAFIHLTESAQGLLGLVGQDELSLHHLVTRNFFNVRIFIFLGCSSQVAIFFDLHLLIPNFFSKLLVTYLCEGVLGSLLGFIFLFLSLALGFELHQSFHDHVFILLIPMDTQRYDRFRVRFQPMVHIFILQELNVADVASIGPVTAVVTQRVDSLGHKLFRVWVVGKEQVVLGALLQGVVHRNVGVIHKICQGGSARVVVLQARV